jgi:hypothetical protein
MKMLRSFAMIATIVAFLSLAFTTRAQTTTTANQQTVAGTASVKFDQTAPADFLNGEHASGTGDGTYNITDPTNAQGSAGATGVGTGSHTGPVVSPDGTTINSNGNANSTINTFALGSGANASIGAAADAQQATWSGTSANPITTTFANAGESTTGGFTGTINNANGTSNVNGTGTSTGETLSSTVNAGGLDVTSTFKASGSSTGVITASSTDPTATQQISSAVSGNGAANGASFAGDTSGTFADAAANGTAAYNGSNQTGAKIQGALELSGKTNSVISKTATGQTSVSASSAIASQAQVK